LRPVFERLAVVGLGLLGGSVALAARKHGAAGQVRGVDPGLDEAGEIPLVGLTEAARWADLVLLAVPVDAMESVLSQLAPLGGPGTLLTDVASVKAPMAELARRCLPYPENCVGAHPMAGSHESGWPAARADLFEGRACFVTPAGTEAASTVDRIDEFWQCLGALTVRYTPEDHDSVTAVLSHVPHVIAFAFALGLPGEEVLELAGPGLRDFIRIARGNPKLWCEILLMNRDRVTEEVARFRSNLEIILRELERGDSAALEELLERARESSEKLR
jgi:prephenate dehydrogenase